MADFTAEQRDAAVLEAASARFNVTVKEAFLDRGMSVRALRVTLEQLAKQRGPVDPALGRLLPARFDERASTSAKLELVKGQVRYTIAVAAKDESAAVLRDEREELRLGYLVTAGVTSDGELKDPQIVRVDELRAKLGEGSARASRK